MVRLLNNFTRVCNEELCSCDYRINIYECSHSEFYVIAGKILISICILVTIISGGSLFYLIKVRKQPFFLSATRERGWLRPKPLHSYHLIAFSYMFLEALHLIALVNELYPSIVAAELGNITTNVVTASAAIFYPISIVYSTPNVEFGENYELSSKNNSLNTRLVDIIGILLFLLPIVTWYPLAFLTGQSAEMNDVKTANFFYKIHYLAFVIWEIIYDIVLAYFWYKLISIIKGYVKLLEERHISSGITDFSQRSQPESIKRSTRNIAFPVMGTIGGLLYQAIIYIAMSFTHRTITIYSFKWNVFYYWTEYAAFPIIGLFVESLLLRHIIISSKKSTFSNVPSSLTQANSGTEMSYTENNNIITNTINTSDNILIERENL